MSFVEWLNQVSPKVLAGVLGAAVFAGLGAGAWLKLPDGTGRPAAAGDLSMIQAEDPGREKWNQVVASLGGLGATFVAPAVFDSGPPPAAEFAPDPDEQLAATRAEIDAELRQSEERATAWRMAWQDGEQRRYTYSEPVRSADAQPVRYAEPPRYAEAPRYAEPVRYSEPVRSTEARRYAEPVAYAEPVYAPRRYEPPADAEPVYAPARRWERAPAPPEAVAYERPTTVLDDTAPPPPPRPALGW